MKRTFSKKRLSLAISKKKTTKSKNRKTKIIIRSAKPKLLIATDSYLPRWDGIARFLNDILPELTSQFSVTVIAPQFPGKHERMKGISEILMPMYSFIYGDYQLPRFEKKLAKQAVKDADIIWTHTIGPIGKNIIYMGKKQKKIVISYIHSIEWELFGRSLGQPWLYYFLAILARKLVRKIYAKSDILMFPSYFAMHLFSWYKFKSKKLLSPLGIDVKTFVPPKSKLLAKKHIGLKADDIVIGYCGRIAHEKDVKTLIRAFLRIRDFYPTLKLLLVGSGIPDLMRRFGNIKGVIVTGAKNSVVPYYQAMDIYVLPSLTETTSLSTLEAMSCGTAVCSTPVGEVANYIKHKKNGFFFSKGNSFELSHYLRLLLDNPDLRKEVGIEARKTVVSSFDWRNASKNIISQLKHAVRR